MSSSAYRIGLTGGIGSGKSTVAQMLAAHGAVVIDADQISKQVTAPGGAALAAVRESFGPQAIASDGAMDRHYMRQRVFQTPADKQRLEAIIHPLVAQEAERLAQSAMAAGAHLLVFDIPLLTEIGRKRYQLSSIWVVDCQEETQIKRVMARQPDWPRDLVQRIIQSQASRAERRAIADICIDNDALSLAQLRAVVASWVTRLGL